MAPHANEAMDGLTNGHGPSVAGSTNGSFNAPTSNNDLFTVTSPNVTYTPESILSKYTYRTTSVSHDAATGNISVAPKETPYSFKVSRNVPRVGVMLVGWGGNNGTTVTAGLLANKRNLVWETREGPRKANYYGSVVMSSTVKLGIDTATGEEVHVPFNKMLPMVHPNDLVVGGWDISAMDMGAAMDRAQVLEPALKNLVKKDMAGMKPLKSIYYPDFIAANQGSRADNVIEGDKACWDHVERIRKDIRSVNSPTC